MKDLKQLMEQIDKMNEADVSESYISDQQAEFKKERSKVEYVLSKHSKILTSEEIKLLQYYQRYINNKETSMSYSDIDKVKPILKYLTRV